MNNGKDNFDDLFDDNIGKSLRELGFLFPKTDAEFKTLEKEIKNSKMPQLNRLKDPYAFLGKRSYKKQQLTIGFNFRDGYGQNFAQAAREGNCISDELKQKMAEDKKKANDKNKGN
jgi:hypothetical protein